MTPAQLDPFFYRQKPASLAEWLAIAAKELVPPAQARVRAEIEAHYLESIRGHQEQGLTEALAASAALTELGNAHAAGRRFRWELLTEKDAMAVTGLLKRSLRQQIVCLVGLALVFAVTYHYFPDKSVQVPLSFIFLYALDVPGIYFGRPATKDLANVYHPSTHLRQMVHGHFIVSLVMGLGAVLLSWSFGPHAEQPSNGLVIGAIFFCSSLRLYRLWRKLQAAAVSDSRFA